MSDFVRSEYINDKGEAVIHVQIDEDYEVYDPLSTGKTKDLNQDIYDYIDRQSNLIPSSIQLVIIFHGRTFTEEEQEHIRSMMHEHYQERWYDLQWDKIAQVRRVTWLTLVAAVMLGIYAYMTTSAEHAVFEEVLSMIGTVAGWEAADMMLLDRRDINIEMRNVKQNLNQTVVFEGTMETAE